LDPDFALAYARLSLCHTLLTGIYYAGGADMADLARKEAKKALDLNPNLMEAYIAMGLIQEILDNDWDAATATFRKAIELSPGSVEPHIEYGLVVLRSTSNLKAAMAEFELAMELDPHSIQANSIMAIMLIINREFHQAVNLCKTVLESDPDNIGIMFYLSQAYMYIDRIDLAIEVADSMVALERGQLALSMAGWVYAVAGRKKEAEAILHELGVRWPDHTPFGERIIPAALGNWDPYLTYLEQRYNKTGGYLYQILFPIFDPVRSDPRVQRLMKILESQKVSREE
jgi:serine/threonine-protein kinase